MGILLYCGLASSLSKKILGLYRDNGKENGNYHLEFRVYGLGYSPLLSR